MGSEEVFSCSAHRRCKGRPVDGHKPGGKACRVHAAGGRATRTEPAVSTVTGPEAAGSTAVSPFDRLRVPAVLMSRDGPSVAMITAKPGL